MMISSYQNNARPQTRNAISKAKAPNKKQFNTTRPSSAYARTSQINSNSMDTASQKVRVQAMLISKLKPRYGGTNAIACKIVEKEVESFVRRMIKITTSDLTNLEHRVKAKCLSAKKKRFLLESSKNKKTAKTTTSSTLTKKVGKLVPISSNSINSDNKRNIASSSSRLNSVSSCRSNHSNVSSTSSRISKPNLRSTNSKAEALNELDETRYGWMLIDSYQQVMHEKQEDEKLRKQANTNNSILKTLKTQVDQKKFRNEQEKAEDVLFAKYLKEDTENWKNEEAAKEQRLRELYAKEKKIREQQILETKKKLSDKLRRKRIHEVKDLSRIQRDLKRSAKIEADKRKQQRLNYLTTMEYNKQQRLIREREKSKEAEHDLFLMEQYKAMLDKQESARTQWYNATYQKQRMRQAANKANRKEEFERAKALEDKIAEYALKKEAEDKRNEEERKKAIRDRTAETNKILAKQIHDKRLRLKEIDENNMKYAAFLRAEAEKALKEENLKTQSRFEKNLYHRKELEAQISSKKINNRSATYSTNINNTRGSGNGMGNAGRDDMSMEEFRINKSILKDMKSTPDVYQKVIKKVLSPKKQLGKTDEATGAGNGHNDVLEHDDTTASSPISNIF